ncbi:MAG: PRC-barrel domain-containing protein [Allosphingosinicella sp.]
MNTTSTMTRGSDTGRDKDLSRSETGDLISSAKVEGTTVVGRDGEKLGSIHHFMVGKRDGRVRYAVMSFGGLFGMGENYHPLPWDQLTYDDDKGGYAVSLDQDRLKDSPSFRRDSEPSWDRDYNQQVHGYYGSTF